MNTLVDTQTVIWFAENNPALSMKARVTIEDSANLCFVSMASFWEMSIKINLGKLNIKGLTLDDFIKEVEAYGFLTLDISIAHVLRNSKLPFHHRDPFDRLIIAQALTEDMIIITSDDVFEAYNVQRISNYWTFSFQDRLSKFQKLGKSEPYGKMSSSLKGFGKPQFQ